MQLFCYQSLAKMRIKLQKAFTLIEIMVVISLILLVSLIGLINYSSINKKQSVIQQAKNIASLIQLTQNNAYSQKKPSEDCSPLSAYIFTFIRSNKTYKIEAKCGGMDYKTGSGAVNPSIPVDKNFTIAFYIQTKAVVFDGVPTTPGIKITIGDPPYQNFLIVCKGGVIRVEETNPGSSYCP